jgi:hypothetical protein
LARKSTCDEVAGDTAHISDVSIVEDAGEVLGEQLACIFVYFAESDGLESGSAGGKGESADSTKEVEMSPTVMANQAPDRMRVGALSSAIAGDGWLVAHRSAYSLADKVYPREHLPDVECAAPHQEKQLHRIRLNLFQTDTRHTSNGRSWLR